MKTDKPNAASSVQSNFPLIILQLTQELPLSSLHLLYINTALVRIQGMNPHLGLSKLLFPGHLPFLMHKGNVSQCHKLTSVSKFRSSKRVIYIICINYIYINIIYIYIYSLACVSIIATWKHTQRICTHTHKRHIQYVHAYKLQPQASV